MLNQPIFSAPLNPEIAGDDPLGLAPTNERLYGAVFPGVNNYVRYIRVYSALCWMTLRGQQYVKENESTLKQREARQVLDHAMEKIQLLLAWANKEKGYRQIAGTDRKFPNDDRLVRLTFSSFGGSTASLLDPVAYRPSITNGLGFLERRSGGSFACTPAGVRLAAAFDAQARKSRRYHWLSDVLDLEARRSDVTKMADILDVGNPSSLEQEAFLAQFFPLQQERELDNFTRNRWLAVNLTLQSVDAICRAKTARGEPGWASEEEIRTCMARGRADNKRLLSLDRLGSVQAWWAVLQLRQLQRLALDVLYCLVERWLGANNAEDEDKSIDTCAKHIGASVVVGLELGEQSVSALMSDVMRLRGTSESLYAAACSMSSDELLDVFGQIKELRNSEIEFDETGGCQVVTSAYVALVFCALETANLLASPEAKNALLKDQDSCSLISLLHLVQRMAQHSPEALMAYLVKHWVILRHFQVVAERSRDADGKNRFRFVVGDRGLERFDPTVGFPRPAFAQDRLKHILILCWQCGLLEGQVDAYRLSTLGMQQVKKSVN